MYVLFIILTAVIALPIAFAFRTDLKEVSKNGGQAKKRSRLESLRRPRPRVQSRLAVTDSKLSSKVRKK